MSEQSSAEPTFTGSIIAYSSRANDLVYHAPSGKIYASIPGGPAGGNAIARIDPATGVVEKSIWIGSEPNKLRLAGDGSTLYVGLDGPRAIRAFDLLQEVPGAQFQVGLTNSDGPLRIVDFAAAPNNPQLIAVSRNAEASSGPRGVALFDNGIQRPNASGGANAITFAGSDSALIGSEYYSNSGLQSFTIDQSGITAASTFNGTARGSRLVYSQGRIYTSLGHIVNSATGELIGTFPLPDAYTSDRPFVIDNAANKAFYVARNFSGFRIDAFDLSTFVLIGSVEFYENVTDPRSVVRWGANGLAVSFSDGPTRIIQSDLVAPGPVAPSAEPPLPNLVKYSPARIRRIDLQNNDLLFNRLDDRLYVSVPGSAGVGVGNTITRLDPVSGTIESSVFIGSEPNVLGLSDDGSTIYASLDGANAVRSFDTISQTSGQQFVPANNGYTTQDIEVLSGTTNSIVISAGNGKVAVYDSGVKRPTVPNADVGPLEGNDSGSVVYGYNDTDTGFNLYKMDVNSQGLSVVSNVSNLIFRFNVKMKYADGLLFVSDGRVVDPETNRILGRFPVSGINKAVEVDLELRQAYFAYQDRIEVFNIDTYNQLGIIRLPDYPDDEYPATKIVRWGRRGLGIRVGSASGGFLVLVESNLLRKPSPYDFDGDGKADPSVFRSQTGDWYVLGSQAGFFGAAWGNASDRLVPADYDGDGKTDFAINRDGVWWILNSDGSGYNGTGWGLPTDIPVPADYDGDGKADLAIFREGVWWILNSTGGYEGIGWGLPTDVPVPADYDGDGKADLAIVRDGVWWILNSNGSGYTGTAWGLPTDIPVPADYDGDGKTDLAILRDGVWWVLNSNGGGYTGVQWGNGTDKPVPADYDGDGKADPAVFRDGNWYILNSNGTPYTTANWGLATDIPIPLRN